MRWGFLAGEKKKRRQIWGFYIKEIKNKLVLRYAVIQSNIEEVPCQYGPAASESGK